MRKARLFAALGLPSALTSRQYAESKIVQELMSVGNKMENPTDACKTEPWTSRREHYKHFVILVLLHGSVDPS